MVLPKRQVIYTRDSLIKWVMDHAPSPTIRRCFDEGRVINLGAYDPIAPFQYPGWVLKLITRFNRVIYVAVMVKDLTYIVRDVTDAVDQWKDNYKQGVNELYKGDNTCRP
jgi:hypothetical protein